VSDPVIYRLSATPGNPPQVVAATNDGRMIPVVWPPGYTATFDPALTVFDPVGKAIAHGGDRLSEEVGLPGLTVCPGPAGVSLYSTEDIH